MMAGTPASARTTSPTRRAGSAGFQFLPQATAVQQLAAMGVAAADDNNQRLASLDALRGVTRRDDVGLAYSGYHDVIELPSHIPRVEDVA